MTEYKLTVGRTSKGIYWARLDSDTHYATATSDEDPWTAALNAVHEAQFLIVSEDVREPDGQRMEAGRIVPTDR